MAINTRIKLSIPKKLPFLEAICWQTENVYRFDLEQMLSRYERGWRYRNLFNNLEGQELDFLKQLAKHYIFFERKIPCLYEKLRI